jgi:hypothetical protein
MNTITSEHLSQLRDLERYFSDHITKMDYKIRSYARDHIGERNKMLDANRENFHQCKDTIRKFCLNFENFYALPQVPAQPHNKEESDILQYAFAIRIKQLETDLYALKELTSNQTVLIVCEKEISDMKSLANEFEEFIQTNS